MKYKSRKPSITSLKKKVQTVFNYYIRLRDQDQPCISCGRNDVLLQAGHFFAVKNNDSLRYNEDNVNGECQHCNAFNESHLIWYYDNLKLKIGESRFNNLKNLASEYKEIPHKWTLEELYSLEKLYKEKVDALSSKNVKKDMDI